MSNADGKCLGVLPGILASLGLRASLIIMYHDIVMTLYICFPFQTNLGNMEVIRYTATQWEKDFLQNNTAVLAMEMRRNWMKKLLS